MSKAKHTPAPWSIEPGENKGAWIGHKNAWAALACGNTDEEAAANARLIAEAPTMYELLRQYAETMGVYTPQLKQFNSKVEELIKKIEG